MLTCWLLLIPFPLLGAPNANPGVELPNRDCDGVPELPNTGCWGVVGGVDPKPKIGEGDGVLLVDAPKMGVVVLETVAAEDPPKEKVVGVEDVVNEELKTGPEFGEELGACQLVPNRGELIVLLELAEEFVELN